MSNDGLVFQSVSKVFPGVTALSDVNVHVSPGRVTGLLGENGAGKSTFIHLAAAVLPPTSGSIVRPPGVVGWCAQRQMIDWFVDCKTNVWLGARLSGLRGADAWEATDRALEQVSLTGSALSRTPEVLSGGQQQRLMIARTLAMRPTTLLLDEPTVGLDALNVSRLTEALSDARGRGATIVVSSHEFETVESILDDVIFLDGGKLLFQGSVGSFVRRFVAEEVVTVRFANDIEESIAMNLRGQVLKLDLASRSVDLRVGRDVAVAELTSDLPCSAHVLEVFRRPASLRDAVISATSTSVGSPREGS